MTSDRLSNIRKSHEMKKNHEKPDAVGELLDYVDELKLSLADIADAYEGEGCNIWGNSEVLDRARRLTGSKSKRELN